MAGYFGAAKLGGWSWREPENRWPTLADIEGAVRERRVIYGSELEQLIETNQNTSVLRPEESEDDGVDIPLWLRVHYRKNHPDQSLAKAGAVGDYPEYLENLHEWMKRNQNSIQTKSTPAGGGQNNDSAERSRAE